MIAVSKQELVQQNLNNKFNFTVDKFRLYGPDNIPTKFFGCFRSDTMEAVGANAVKKDYVPHNLDDVSALCEASIDAFDSDFDMRCVWGKNGHIVNIRPSKDYRREVAGKDVIFPTLNINAGYGGRAFLVNLLLDRDICANLMMLRNDFNIRASIKHNCNLREHLGEICDQLYQLTQVWDSVVQTAQELNDKRCKLKDFIMHVFPEPAKEGSAKTRHQNRMDAIYNRIMREHHALGLSNNIQETSLWLAYNGIQGYIQHESSRHNNPTKDQRAIMALEDRYVNRAMEHAIALAA